MIIILFECVNIFNISSLYTGKYGENNYFGTEGGWDEMMSHTIGACITFVLSCDTMQLLLRRGIC